MLGDVNSDRQFPDYGLDRFGLAGTDGSEPADWSTTQIANFGSLSPSYGITGGFGFLAEVEEDPITGLARTPMIELGINDYLYTAQTGLMRPGTVGYGDDGTVYQFRATGDGLGGFFSSIFKGAKKLFSGVVKGAKGLVKGAISMGTKLLSKLPGGKYLVKIMGQIHKVAMKLVKPLIKFVGPIAKKLAPIAALIPGYGPAISAALYNVGKIPAILKAFDVTQDKHGRPKFKSGKQASGFKRALKQAAEHARRTGLHKTHAMKGRVLKVGTPPHRAAMIRMGIKPVVAPRTVPYGVPSAPAVAPSFAPSIPQPQGPAVGPGGMPPGGMSPEWFAKMMESYGYKDLTPGGPTPSAEAQPEEAAAGWW